MKRIAITTAIGMLLILGGCTAPSAYNDNAVEYVGVTATVVGFEPEGMRLRVETLGGVGSGQLYPAAVVTIKVISPKRYAGRELAVLISEFPSREPIPGTTKLQKVGSAVNLLVRKDRLRNTSKQLVDLPNREALLLDEKQPNKLPIPTPADVTPAAGAPVAPPSRAASR
jgi:hypothetical protein